jgi:transcriptional regulator with XRE-family HTH domain
MSRRDATRWPVWHVIREARHRAGLHPGEVAARVGTGAVAIARFERALTLPDVATLHRLVEACGYRLRLEVVEPEAEEFPALEWSVEERLRRNDLYVGSMHEVHHG